MKNPAICTSWCSVILFVYLLQMHGLKGNEQPPFINKIQETNAAAGAL